ncbi:MAG: hypothetical protein ACI9WU_004735 [Myxococcota bacterium]
MTGSSHEDLSRGHTVEKGTPRSFGIVFGVVFAVVGLLPLLGGGSPRWWALGLSATFALLGFVRPALLAPLNDLWLAFGDVLQKVVNPVIMGVLFFGLFLPMGLLMRALGKRPLTLERQPDASSYWIERTPPGPKPESLRDQF